MDSEIKPTVLVVDDTPKNIQVLGSMLRDKGYAVSVAQNGMKAIEIAEQILPDIILLDIMMPEMDGFETCKRLKASERTLHIPVIFLTALTEQDEVVKGFGVGAVDYVTKPFNSVELFARVKTHIELKRKREDLREAKRVAEEATKLKDKFVSIVAHDLKSPFTSLMGYMRLMSKDTKPELDTKHKGMVDKMLATCDSMMEMIGQLLDLSRLQTGSVKPKLRYMNCRAMVQNVITGLEQLAAGKGITIINDIPQEKRIRADFHLMSELFGNLLSNAIKFCEQGDSISLFCPEEDGTAVSIRDSGKGIPAALLPNLFKPDVKTTTTGTAGERGTGLGLPFCHDIAKVHGGTIGVESAEGEGSTFTVRLPYRMPKVLISDDSVPSRETLKAILGDAELTLLEAGDGQEALAIMEKEDIGLQLLDIHMPELDGFDVLRRMKSEGTDVPTVIITSDEKVETRTEGFALGAKDFITKPFHREDILPRIRRFLG